ncbi:hypothetical protein SO802_000414 [Lithocarpus litseifolius]|uniref:Uncharacterized protein n=1 Tax=Lithocarpus litseifolius TaxID=425828 RepID=A0AAW2DVN9_9ROSI
MNLQDWLKFNCKVNIKFGSMGIPWNLIFAFGVWIIWQHRNRVVFQNHSPNYDIHAEVIHRTTEFVFCAQGNSHKSPRVERSIRWERLYCNWFKLNTDGSALGNPGIADMLYYDSPPSNLLEFYLADLYGLFHFRCCPDSDVTASGS